MSVYLWGVCVSDCLYIFRSLCVSDCILQVCLSEWFVSVALPLSVHMGEYRHASVHVQNLTL